MNLIYKMKQLRKSEIKELNEKIKQFEIELGKEDKVTQDNNIIFINDKPMFFNYEDMIVPTLKFILEHDVLKQVIVDMGAVKFVVGGADIMRPGVAEFDNNIQKQDLVVIKDINNKKPLAVGISLFSSEELAAMNSGKIIKNIHHIGDEIWEK